MKNKFRFCNDKRQYYREEYLKTSHWKELKLTKLKEVCQCEKCGTKKSLDVHHINYRNLYDVSLADLMVLCRRCHTQEHENDTHKNKGRHLEGSYEYRRRVQVQTVLPKLSLSVILWILSQLSNDPALKSRKFNCV